LLDVCGLIAPLSRFARHLWFDCPFVSLCSTSPRRGEKTARYYSTAIFRGLFLPIGEGGERSEPEGANMFTLASAANLMSSIGSGTSIILRPNKQKQEISGYRWYNYLRNTFFLCNFEDQKPFMELTVNSFSARQGALML